MNDILEKSVKKFYKEVPKELMSNTIVFGHWILELSNQYKKEVRLEYADGFIGTPFVGGEFELTNIPSYNFKKLGHSEFYSIHTHPIESTFSVTDVKDFLTRGYKASFVITRKNLNCLYRTKNEINFNEREMYEIGERADLEFCKNNKLDPKKFFKRANAHKLKEDIKEKYEEYIEKIREPKFREYLCKIDGLLFSLIPLTDESYAFYEQIRQDNPNIFIFDLKESEELKKNVQKRLLNKT